MRTILSLLSLSEIHSTFPAVTNPETVLYTYNVVCIGASECIIVSVFVVVSFVPIWAYRMNFDFDWHSIVHPYSRKHWQALNLAVEPKIAIARLLVDLNLAVRYRIAIRIYASRKFWRILIWRL